MWRYHGICSVWCCWEGGFNEPAPKPAGEVLTGAFKEKMLHLAVDDDGVAVTRESVLYRASRTEILDCFYFENTPIPPCDGSRVHVPGGVEVGVDLDVDSFGFLSTGQDCHLHSLVEARRL